MSHPLVRQFTVSKSLLQGTDGRIAKGKVAFCYQIKKVLRTSYKQWRITVTSDDVSIKLMDLKGDIVLDEYYYEDSLISDWETLLAYQVMAGKEIEISNLLADA